MALQLIKYTHADPITDFCILVFPDAIFSSQGLKIWYSWSTKQT